MSDNFIPIVSSNVVQTPPDKPSENEECEMKDIKDLWKEEEKENESSR